MRGATAELENKAVGSAQQNISKGIVEETTIVLPPPALVERFASLANPMYERWISNLHQSRTLATLRDTLLPKLLSGELSVGELEN
jgi:type I restriction enzyme S subunit